MHYSSVRETSKPNENWVENCKENMQSLRKNFKVVATGLTVGMISFMMMSGNAAPVNTDYVIDDNMSGVSSVSTSVKTSLLLVPPFDKSKVVKTLTAESPLSDAKKLVENIDGKTIELHDKVEAKKEAERKAIEEKARKEAEAKAKKEAEEKAKKAIEEKAAREKKERAAVEAKAKKEREARSSKTSRSGNRSSNLGKGEGSIINCADPSGDKGLQPWVAQMRTVVKNKFGISNIGGTRPGDPRDHGKGLALDVMVPVGSQLGDDVANWAISNMKDLNLHYVIWEQQIYGDYNKKWKWMEDRGNKTANHYDHVHLSFHTGSGKCVS